MPLIVFGVVIRYWKQLLAHIDEKTARYKWDEIDLAVHTVSLVALVLVLLLDLAADIRFYLIRRRINSSRTQNGSSSGEVNANLNESFVSEDNGASNLTEQYKRSGSWLEVEETKLGLWARIKTLGLPYYLLVVSIALFHVAWYGLQFNSAPYFAYKFGFQQSFAKEDQTVLAMTQFALFVPVVVSSIISALIVEHRGRRIVLALLGLSLLAAGNFMYRDISGYSKAEASGPKPTFVHHQRAFWPAVLGSLGAGIYGPVLLGSISYMARNSIQGFAFGFALSAANSLEIIWFAIADAIVKPDVLEAGTYTFKTLVSGDFFPAVAYLER